MDKRVFIVGVGMTKFLKPSDNNPDYPDLAKVAVQRALRDAGLPYSKIELAAVGYVYGDSTCGQRALYECGVTGIPIYNVNNNCSTGSTALELCYNMIQNGKDCALALGFEKMAPGSLQIAFPHMTYPVGRHIEVMGKMVKPTKAPFASQLFGNAGMEHQEKYGTQDVHFAKIGYKNHKHSVNNPYSQFRDEYTLDQVMKSQKIYGPLTKLQCCPTSDGSAAAIVCSEKFMKEHGLEDQAVEILGIALTTDTESTFAGKSRMSIAGYDMSKAAAQQVFKKTGKNPKDVQVCELHDCFSANELITYEALGLVEPEKVGEFIDRGENTYGGRCVVNPSGGLISKGHPLGATGLAQCTELCWQLRGMAEKRQVEGAKLALQHNIGLGGACVVALYQKYNSNRGYKRTDQTSDPDKLEEIEKNELGLQKNPTSLLMSNKTSLEMMKTESERIFDLTKEYVNQNGTELCQQVNAIISFEVLKSKGDKNPRVYTIDLKNAPGEVYEGQVSQADAKVVVVDEALVELVEGRLSLQKALLQGKLKFKGNINAALKFSPDHLPKMPKL